MISNIGLNPLKLYHGVPQTLKYRNGFRVPTPPARKAGDEPLDGDSVQFVSENDGIFFDPILTYGRIKQPKQDVVLPDYVTFDRIVLKFRGYFKQLIPGLQQQNTYRTRYVNVMYFMEDDTMTVMEPPVMNSGYPQGRIIRRAKIPKDPFRNGYYTWKDLNIGIDLEMFGIKFHLSDCDRFTREFLESQGIELNEIEKMPAESPETASMKPRKSYVTRPSTGYNVKKMNPNKNYNRIVLTFDCVLIEEKKQLEDSLTFKLYYFLEDDTISIKELKENQEGRDYFPMLFKRSRPPKHSKLISINNVLLASDVNGNENEDDSTEYYEPFDLMIGEVIKIYGHPILLVDCDIMTRKYYHDVLKKPQKHRLCIKTARISKRPPELPDYLGFGTPEDSLASCFGLIPKAPRKDIVTYLKYTNKYLRFGCILDSAHPEDKDRRFVLKYSLADGKISIAELPTANSGIDAGKFLSPQLVVKPGSNPKLPEYYSAKDLYVGAVLKINFHRFVLISADLAVYNYMVEHPELFSADAIESVRNYLKVQENKLSSAAYANQAHSTTNESEATDFNLNNSMNKLTIRADAAAANDGYNKEEEHFMNNYLTTDENTMETKNCIEKKVRFDTEMPHT